MIVTEGPTLTVAKVEECWGDQPPVTELHLVAIPRLEEVIGLLYTDAAELTYGDVASGAPHLVTGPAHTPGLAAPVISDEAVKALRLSDGETSPVLLIEASLWLLADWDGMGTARARELVDKATDPQVQELARLLTGAGTTARRALRSDEALGPFAQAVTDAWDRTLTDDATRRGDEISSRSTSMIPASHLPSATSAPRCAIAFPAIRQRWSRRPALWARTSIMSCARCMRFGKQAFWPSQAAAIEGGLLDPGHLSMAIKMPTSAGKTTLVELVTADALDTDDDGVAVVLAPTKALVRQLSSDLRKALPRHGDRPLVPWRIGLRHRGSERRWPAQRDRRSRGDPRAFRPRVAPARHELG